MSSQLRERLRHAWLPGLIVALLGGYWLAPISGQVLVIPGRGAALAWPQMRLDPPAPRPGAPTALLVTDTAPWPYVLATVDGQPMQPGKWWRNPGGTWTWRWTLAAPPAEGSEIVFYHDCQTGCRERGKMYVGRAGSRAKDEGKAAGLPTKLGVAFANPERDWHGRAGWDVELTYALLGNEAYWGADDLAARVRVATDKGLRVLVRVDYDRGQSLPPAGDYAALSGYLAYVRRLACDDRLRGVYGYIVGSGYNALDANSAAPSQPVTPGWYARVFNGYGEAAGRSDNVLQVVRAENATTRVLVGPVRPWTSDQGGERAYAVDAPWLNYMNTLVAALDEGARTKAAAGIAVGAADGFALQAPGRPGAAELAGKSGAEEPRLDLPREAWQGAQSGFRVYRDWLAIVNSYPSTRGLPVYITAANTYAPDEGVPPAENYPPGWLTAALEEIDAQPQVQALCWFLDGPLGDTQWDGFSLGRRLGRMADAADEFDALLRETR